MNNKLIIEDNYFEESLDSPIKFNKKILIDNFTQTDHDDNSDNFIYIDSEKKSSESIETDSSDSLFSSEFDQDLSNNIIEAKLFQEQFAEFIVMDQTTQTDPIESKEQSIQTDNLNTKEYIEKLEKDYEKLEKSFRDVVQLLSVVTKTYIDTNNSELDNIRNQVLILMNRELRMRFAFPFVNFLGKYNKF